ncbi:sugar phosphate isomerase/epimerase family protein [Maribacter stanieri]|uniref:sugar phosphate isomerase/epimerase family protein n=1 Tax=Maribacter stanieri TaxID=440514 RepID=UPI002494F9D0|nr:sugar phosphate isomerase/epimerase [Maribacter stanieri]|tara:strand:- start:487 stop:1365 length:879 start_codon:yes stop_codon:yes gene_type:complete
MKTRNLKIKGYLFSLCFGLLLGLGNVWGQSGEPLFSETPGLVSYTHRKSFEKNVAATLDTIQSLGVTDMEFSNLFGTKPTDLRQMLDIRGIKCSSYGVSYDDLINNTDEVGQTAKILGASFVRVAWIPHEGKFKLQDAERAAMDFNNAGKKLKKKYGITFCYHNHGFEFQTHNGISWFDYLMNNTNPKYVSYEMDILWTFLPGENPAELLRKYGSRFKLMHLKDLKIGVPSNHLGKTSSENDVALGEGQINIPEVLRAAKEVGIEHYYIEDESSRINVQVPQSIAYLKGLKD